jgi:hypothetical protein
MSTDKADKKYAVSILHGHDKSVIVPLDIEYDTVVGQKAGIAVNILYVCRSMPFGLLNIIIPCL